LSQVLLAYMATRLNFKPGAISLDAINSQLIDRDVPDQLTREVRSCLDNLQHMAYAPGETASQSGDLIAHVSNLIRRLHSVL